MLLINLVSKRIDSPVGLLKLVANDASLAAILWENDSARRVRLGPLVEILATPDLSAERQLAEYFPGSASSSMSRSPAGTLFQTNVWQALLTILHGETRSYDEIARQVGHAAAVRAVGAANGRNPISVIAPYHRMVTFPPR